MKKGQNQQDKPFKSMNGKVFVANREVLNAEVYCEVNANKVDIDRSTFKHTVDSRLALKQAKRAWNKNPNPCQEVVASLVGWMKQKYPRNNAHVIG